MRTYDYLGKTQKNLLKIIDELKVSDKKTYLLRIHSASVSGEEMKDVIKHASRKLPKVAVTGCSCGGVILGGKSYSDNSLISLTELEDAEVGITSIKIFDGEEMKPAEDAAEELVSKLGSFDKSLLLIFYSSRWNYASGLGKALSKYGTNFAILGGGSFSATGDELNDQSYTICNDKIEKDALVCVKLQGDSFFCAERMTTGIEALGKAYAVTDVSGHVIKQIDGVPAQQWYKRLIGDQFIEENPDVVHSFPLVRSTRPDACIDMLFDVNPFTGEALGEDIFVFDTLKEGEMVHIGCINPDLSVREARNICEVMQPAPMETMFMYSCMARRAILKNCSSWEMSPYTETQCSGAFMAGELGYDGTENRYSNCAFVATALSEDYDAHEVIRKDYLDDSSSVQFDNQYLLTYFLSRANTELKSEMFDSLERLEKNISYDDLSGLPSLSRFIFDCEMKGIRTALLISLKNEDTIKAFTFGRGESVLSPVIGTCQRYFGSKASIYSNSDMSLIVGSAELSTEEILHNAEIIYRELTTVNYEDCVPVWQFSVAEGEPADLLKRLNLTRMSQTRSGARFLLYDENGPEQSAAIRELAVLDAINEALVTDRVIPYYQGIQNNMTGRTAIYEALMRVTDHKGRIYTPMEVIRVANAHGLYPRLSRKMVERVFDDTAKASAAITMNLSIQDLMNHELTDYILGRLEDSARPERFIFEIIDTDEVEDFEVMMNFAKRIRETGARLALDGYGTGQSNFLRFVKLSPDFVKISGDIVKEAEKNPDVAEFIEFVCSWAKRRSQKVVCEGVENERIQQIVVAQGCEYSQGFFLSKPLPIKECGMIDPSEFEDDESEKKKFRFGKN